MLCCVFFSSITFFLELSKFVFVLVLWKIEIIYTCSLSPTGKRGYLRELSVTLRKLFPILHSPNYSSWLGYPQACDTFNKRVACTNFPRLLCIQYVLVERRKITSNTNTMKWNKTIHKNKTPIGIC